MCFYSKLSKKAIELENRFKARMEQGELFSPSTIINGFSFPKTPIITNKSPEIIQLYHWGLIPPWAKDPSIRKHTLNARIESLDQKPAFRTVSKQRCLVISDGFYEWQWLDTAGKKKQKYLLGLPGDNLFAFAGIYSEWIHPETAEWIPSYSIVTTEASGLMEKIHNSKLRMPVLLSPELEDLWLEGKNCMDFAKPHIELIATPV